ncbi:hypothetical protein P3S67_028211 [Capsicum chacoense]
MIIHPVGDGEGHISLYLAIVGTSSLHADWEMSSERRMERRFRNIKTEWVLLEMLSHETFKDPSNGYLVNDKCIFGVDVYVIKPGNRVINALRVIPWRLKTLPMKQFLRRKLLLYHTGNSGQNGQSISVFLESVDAEVLLAKKGQGKICISMKNRLACGLSGRKHEKRAQDWILTRDKNSLPSHG